MKRYICKSQLLELAAVILMTLPHVTVTGQDVMFGVHNMTRIKARLPPAILYPTYDITQYAFEDDISITDQFLQSGIPVPKSVIVKKIKYKDPSTESGGSHLTKLMKTTIFRMSLTNEWGSTVSHVLTVKYWDKPDNKPINIPLSSHLHTSLPCLQNDHYVTEVNHNITWYKQDLHGNSTLHDSDKYYIDLNGTLHIFNTTDEDALDYFCDVTVTHGAFFFHATLNRHLIKSPNVVKPLNTTTTSTTNHRVIRDTHDDTEFDGSDHTTTVVTTTTTATTTSTNTTTVTATATNMRSSGWTTKSQNRQSSSPVYQHTTSPIYQHTTSPVRDLEPSDYQTDYIYTSDHAAASQNESDCDLNIFYITSSKTYVYGSTVILECLCSGQDFPSVEWIYDNTFVHGSALPPRTSQKGRRLVINHVSDDITHAYTCICYNNTSNTVATTTFKVEPSLQWKETSQSINVSEHSNVTFKCVAHWSNGKKVATETTWYINNVTVNIEKQQRISIIYHNDSTTEKVMKLYDHYPANKFRPEIHYWLSNDMSTMLFTNVSWNDALNVQCRVAENNQSIYHSAYLNVFAKAEVNFSYTGLDAVHPNMIKMRLNIYKDPMSDHAYSVQWTVYLYENDSNPVDMHVYKNSFVIDINANTTRNVTCTVQNTFETISRSVYIPDALQYIASGSSNHYDTTMSNTDVWLPLVTDIGWSTVVIVIIIVVFITIKKKWKWIKLQWKYRKQKQSIRFRIALAARSQASNKYVDIHRNKDEFPVDRLRFLDVIGEGNFGKVMKAEALDIKGSGTWDLVAVKMWKVVLDICCTSIGKLKYNKYQLQHFVIVGDAADTATDSFKESFFHEMMMMRKVPKYVHVVEYYGYSFKSDPAFIIMEYIPGGDLLTFLRKRRPQTGKNKQYQAATDLTRLEHEASTIDATSEDVVAMATEDDDDKSKDSAEVNSVNLVSSKDLASFAMQICRGMAHLSNNKIIHRDVAARNVLIGVGNVCKISDLGLARDVEGCDAYERSSMGPLPIRWMPPESLKDGLYTYKSDVWSFGVVLWEIVTLGASPYSGMSARQVMSAVTEGKRLDKPAFCSDEIYDIMTDCWKGYPGDRPTFRELADVIEKLLEEEAEYIQLGNYEEGIYNVIDPNEVAVDDEKL